jgi:3-phenylpropionate/cinnamic acid dioxygenase small subunit
MSHSGDASVQRLLDIEEIKRLKAAYCRLIDDEDWDGFRELFADGGDFRSGTSSFESTEDFLASVIKHHTDADVISVHHAHMPEIEIGAGGTEARGVWALHDYLDRVWKEDGRREAFYGYGFYEEEYRKVDGSWKIVTMHLRRIRVDRVPAELIEANPFPRRGEEVDLLPPPGSAGA